MGVCDVSLIISDENLRKMISDNWQNYGSFYNEDNIREGPLTWSVLPWQKSIDEKQQFSQSYPICRLQPWETLPFWRHVFLVILFWKVQQRYFDLNLNIFKSFTWTLVLVFFSDLVPDNVYKKIAAAFVHYLVSCKLDLKLGHCCSILGQATNQMRFKQTVLMQQGAAILEKREDKFSTKQNVC